MADDAVDDRQNGDEPWRLERWDDIDRVQIRQRQADSMVIRGVNLEVRKHRKAIARRDDVD